MAKIVQSNFSTGEVSEAIGARADIERYLSSVKKCENFIPKVHGGLMNRPGFQFIAEVKDSSTDVRLIPFEFSTQQTYILELGNLYMRVFKDGAQVLDSLATANITAATQANPVELTAASHGLTNGDEVFVDSVAGMVELNGRNFRVASSTTHTFELQDLQGNNLDGTAFTAYTSGGSADKIYEIVTPWADGDLFDLKFVQSADVMTICHIGYAPREVTRTGHNAWTLSTISFVPEQVAPTGVTVTPDSLSTGSETFEYAVTAVDLESGEESLVAEGSTATSVDTSWNNAVSWTLAADAGHYYVYRKKNGIYGYVGRAEGTTFADKFIEPDTNDSPPKARNPFGSSNNYPSTVGYHQQRRVFGSSFNDPQRIWMSQTANHYNMTVSSPLRDDDSITATIASRQVNEVRHFIGLTDLIVLTSGGEWAISGVDGVFTPSGIRLQAQSYYGASDLAPVVAGEVVLYMQPGQIVRDIAFQVSGGTTSYTGNDVSILSRHLLDYNEIKDWDFANSPHSLVTMVRDDGVMLTLTYLREQDVYGWARQTTDGDFKSVASVRESDKDAVYVVVERFFSGVSKKFVERMSKRDFNDIQDCFFVDSGLSLNSPVTMTGFTNAGPVVITAPSHGLSNGDTVDVSDILVIDSTATRGSKPDTDIVGNGYTAANVTTNTFELQNSGLNVDGTAFEVYHSGGKVRKALSTISNLWHINGRTVSILANGLVQPEQTVVNGTITLITPASRVHVGLAYTCEVETLRVDIGQNGGSSQGKMKKISRVDLNLENTLGGWLGPNREQMREIKYGLPKLYGQPNEWVTGNKALTSAPSWNKNGNMVVQQRDPLPMTILSIIPDVTVGGN